MDILLLLLWFWKLYLIANNLDCSRKEWFWFLHSPQPFHLHLLTLPSIYSDSNRLICPEQKGKSVCISSWEADMLMDRRTDEGRQSGVNATVVWQWRRPSSVLIDEAGNCSVMSVFTTYSPLWVIPAIWSVCWYLPHPSCFCFLSVSGFRGSPLALMWLTMCYNSRLNVWHILGSSWHVSGFEVEVDYSWVVDPFVAQNI